MLRTLPVAAAALVLAGSAAASAEEQECPASQEEVKLRESDASADGNRMRVELVLDDPRGLASRVRVMAWDEQGRRRSDGTDGFVVKEAFLTTSDLYRVNIPAEQLSGATIVRWYAAAVDVDGRVLACLGTEARPRLLAVVDSAGEDPVQEREAKKREAKKFRRSFVAAKD